MSVVASTLRIVGMRNSDFGLFELMWYPLGTRNDSGTGAAFPCVTLMRGAGDIFTAGTCWPKSSCADATAADRTSALMTALLAALLTTIFNGPRLESGLGLRPIYSTHPLVR